MTRQDFMCKIATGDRSIRLLRTLVGLRKKAAEVPEGYEAGWDEETLKRMSPVDRGGYIQGKKDAERVAQQTRDAGYGGWELAGAATGSGLLGAGLANTAQWGWDVGRSYLNGYRNVRSLPEFRAMEKLWPTGTAPSVRQVRGTRPYTVPNSVADTPYAVDAIRNLFPQGTNVNTGGSRTYSPVNNRNQTYDAVTGRQMFTNAQNVVRQQQLPSYFAWKRVPLDVVTGVALGAGGAIADMAWQQNRHNEAARKVYNATIKDLQGTYKPPEDIPEGLK